jgi:hypothetical protein
LILAVVCDTHFFNSRKRGLFIQYRIGGRSGRTGAVFLRRKMMAEVRTAPVFLAESQAA